MKKKMIFALIILSSLFSFQAVSAAETSDIVTPDVSHADVNEATLTIDNLAIDESAYLLSGTVSPNTTVEVWDEAGFSGETISDEAGAFSYTFDYLPKRIRVRLVGNSGEVVEAMVFTSADHIGGYGNVDSADGDTQPAAANPVPPANNESETSDTKKQIVSDDVSNQHKSAPTPAEKTLSNETQGDAETKTKKDKAAPTRNIFNATLPKTDEVVDNVFFNTGLVFLALLILFVFALQRGRNRRY